MKLIHENNTVQKASRLTQQNQPARNNAILTHHITDKGNMLCRFDLFIRWPDDASRRINPFTHRGDKFGIIEADKMLCSLLRYFIKDHHKWLWAYLRDNSKPLNDAERIVISSVRGQVKENRLANYRPSLVNFPLPEWLDQQINR